MSVNILIADEHTLIRRGIFSIINTLSASAINGETLNVIGDTDSPAGLVNLLSHNTVNILFSVLP
ncbi:hypothetical protein [Erwinia sp. 9145]|uniref:hypothetical protein n=1 Tax=Erwinia sp. 9145 TaxID=1500895 RepID=UPI000AF1044C|nr:hypothetical protein [Erwinia sp. 9145]